jgi:hypothetical protein
MKGAELLDEIRARNLAKDKVARPFAVASGVRVTSSLYHIETDGVTRWFNRLSDDMNRLSYQNVFEVATRLTLLWYRASLGRCRA